MAKIEWQTRSRMVAEDDATFFNARAGAEEGDALFFNARADVEEVWLTGGDMAVGLMTATITMKEVIQLAL